MNSLGVDAALQKWLREDYSLILFHLLPVGKPYRYDPRMTAKFVYVCVCFIWILLHCLGQEKAPRHYSFSGVKLILTLDLIHRVGNACGFIVLRYE